MWLILFVVSQLVFMGIGLLPLSLWRSFNVQPTTVLPPPEPKLPKDFGKPCVQQECAAFLVGQDRALKITLSDSPAGRWKCWPNKPGNWGKAPTGQGRKPRRRRLAGIRAG